ncbi:MAG: hypothetical protein JWP12_2811 [Bacteroidetes bacterium]|nr:hypothetical protein [Bacteroidota bacterium]
MKKLPLIVLLAATSFLSLKTQAQVDNIPYYTNIRFNSSFAVIAENNANSNFYAVNLNDFQTELEKMYFESIAFQQNKIVRIDAGNLNIAWFKVDKTYTDAEISQLFNSLKQQTITQVGSMTELQRQEWLNTNNK